MLVLKDLLGVLGPFFPFVLLQKDLVSADHFASCFPIWSYWAFSLQEECSLGDGTFQAHVSQFVLIGYS